MAPGVVDTVPAGPFRCGPLAMSWRAGARSPTIQVWCGFRAKLDAEIVLQNPVRIYGMLAFFAAVVIAQILLVLKKKQ